MKDRLGRFRMTRHGLVCRHASHVNLLPTALTEVVETREISTEEIAGRYFAQRTESILQMWLDLETLEKTRCSNID